MSGGRNSEPALTVRFWPIVARGVVSAHALTKPAMTVRVRGARALKRALATVHAQKVSSGGLFPR